MIEYLADIYHTGKVTTPWRLKISDTRIYETLQNNEYPTEEEVINEIKSWVNRYGKEQIIVSEHTNYGIPNPKFYQLMLELSGGLTGGENESRGND